MRCTHLLLGSVAIPHHDTQSIRCIGLQAAQLYPGMAQDFSKPFGWIFQSRWWFHLFFIFYFSDGLKPPTSQSIQGFEKSQVLSCFSFGLEYLNGCAWKFLCAVLTLDLDITIQSRKWNRLTSIWNRFLNHRARTSPVNSSWCILRDLFLSERIWEFGTSSLLAHILRNAIDCPTQVVCSISFLSLITGIRYEKNWTNITVYMICNYYYYHLVISSWYTYYKYILCTYSCGETQRGPKYSYRAGPLYPFVQFPKCVEMCIQHHTAMSNFQQVWCI